jgi:predicted ATPase/DNA-binding CsgD family transcriptional regulator
MNARASKTGEELIEPLTHREQEILLLLSQGNSGPEIAQQLTLALSTVKWYVQQVYGKLGVHNKQQAIIRAEELGLLETHPPVAYVHFSPKHNLPSQLTSFIGREKEIETVKHLLAPHNGGKRSTPQSGSVDRLLTLTGAGGSGKTRLALQVAAELPDAFSDGVWFIDFAPLSDPALVPQSLLTTLGLIEQAGNSSLAIVSNFLQPKRALLILDNCEHLIEACAQLAETLLRACPNLHVLATSREALSVAGEMLYLVPTLTTPNPTQSDPSTLPRYEAVRLFIERAQTALPGFRMTADNTSAVAQVCHQLDGIPLALELAAARVKTLRVEQIAARLAEHEQFRLLTAGSRTALPRHQTLHALIDWSYNLLSEPERVLLRRLAVFAGGWTLGAAEAICVGDGVEADMVLDLMTQLMNKSLILAERAQGQEARYSMLETIRQFSSERLLEAGEGEQLQKSHLDFFLQWAERAESQIRGPHQVKWLDQLEAEHGNFRAALEWILAQAESAEAGLRLASALLSFWRHRGHINEGRIWLDRALAIPASPATRAKALHAAGFLARWQGDVTTSRAQLEDSETLWRVLGPAGKIGLAHTLAALSDTIQQLGDPATARSLADEAIELCRERDDRWGLAFSLSSLGLALRDQEDFGLARSILNESVALWRELGDLWGLRLAYNRLGMLAMRQGDYELARSHFGNDLTIAKSLGDAETIAMGFLDLGLVNRNLGNHVQARTFFEECFGWFRASSNQFGIAFCFYHFGCLALLEGESQQAKNFFEQELALARTSGPIWLGSQALFGLAGVAAASGQAGRAARLFGAAEARLEAAASYIDAADGLFNERTVASAVAQLGEDTFAEGYAEGRAMTFEQAADYALESGLSA